MTVNINMLRGRMVEQGISVDSISKMIGINKATFYRKIKNKGLEFTVGEMHRIGEALHMSEEDMAHIFLFKNSQN